MTRIKTKKTSRKKGRKSSKKRIRIPVKGILYTLFLISLLLFSIGFLGYFIFFRTVVAAELGTEVEPTITFEEPTTPPGPQMEEEHQGYPGDPKCAVIIDDMGYHHDIGRALMRLPLNLSYSFLPHAPHTKELEQAAYQSGRTVLLHLPLEPRDAKWDPGEGALYLGDMENQEAILLENLELVPHATGVNNHMGSLYTEDRYAMESLLKLIEGKKLFYIDSFTSPDSIGHVLAKELGIETARRHLFLDNELEVDAICRQMERLVSIAQKEGRAIGIAHPHNQTLQALRSCGTVLQSSVQLVGVEELVQ